MVIRGQMNNTMSCESVFSMLSHFICAMAMSFQVLSNLSSPQQYNSLIAIANAIQIYSNFGQALWESINQIFYSGMETNCMV